MTGDDDKLYWLLTLDDAATNGDAATVERAKGELRRLGVDDPQPKPYRPWEPPALEAAQ